MKKYALILLLASVLLSTCKKEEVLNSTVKEFNDEKTASLSFSNYLWIVKSNTSRIGPGPNFFSSSAVSVDSLGQLHLKIFKSGSKWLCSEVLSNDNFGYGKYIFVTLGNIEHYNKKIVAGLFTWDDNTYQTQVNDELDIEFSKWGIGTKTKVMSYSVQPTYTNTGSYPERSNTPITNLIYDNNGLTTHVINWKNDRVIFETHTGDDTSATSLTHTWTFNNSNPPRATDINGYWSNSIIIPQPGITTKAHINFWLIDYNHDGKGDAPSDALPAELIVKRFQFIPN